MRAQQLEIPNPSYLLSIIGIVNIPVRMLFGLVADRKIIAPINLNTMSVMVATAPLFFYFALTTFSTQAIFSVMFAIGIAGIHSLTTMDLVQLVGLKKFNNGEEILDFFKVEPAKFYSNLVCMVIIIIGWRVMTFLVLLIKSRQR